MGGMPRACLSPVVPAPGEGRLRLSPCLRARQPRATGATGLDAAGLVTGGVTCAGPWWNGPEVGSLSRGGGGPSPSHSLT